MVLASSSLLLLSTAAWLAPPAALSVAPDHIGHAPSTAYRHGARTAPARLSAGSNADAGSTDDSSLFAALRARQAELADERAQLAARWREGQCQSSVRLNLHDWIRRLALSWPMVALGTASGGVYVCDLSSGKLLAGELNAHPAYLGGQEAELELLHGEYDGGGITVTNRLFNTHIHTHRHPLPNTLSTAPSPLLLPHQSYILNPSSLIFPRPLPPCSLPTFPPTPSLRIRPLSPVPHPSPVPPTPTPFRRSLSTAASC